MLFLVLFLGALVLYAICWPTREGVSEQYNLSESENAIVLAKKNDANLLDLTSKMDELNKIVLQIRDKMEGVKQSSDANTENINTLVEKCK
jgi:hypothetical protein